MKEVTRNISIGVFIVIFLIFFGKGFENNTYIQISLAVASSIIAPIFVFFIDSFLQNITRLKLWFITKIKYRNKKVRVSMSYIYRIRVSDKYLLVKNSKWDYYQPVGGAYKILSEDIGFLKDNFEWGKDPYLKTDGIKRNDLRGTVPMTKLIKFLDWFKTQKNREISHWREFFEELIRTNILSVENFPHIEYRYAGTLLTPIKKSDIWPNCFEILSYDVYDLIPSNEQEAKLYETQTKISDKYKWVEESVILNNGIINKDEEIKLGQHTKWTIQLKYPK